jgi:hypothetical protein
MNFPGVRPDGCFSGAKTLTTFQTLPFDQLEGVLCEGPQGNTITLTALADFGHLGPATLTGTWAAGNWSLTGALADPGLGAPTIQSKGTASVKMLVADGVVSYLLDLGHVWDFKINLLGTTAQAGPDDGPLWVEDGLWLTRFEANMAHSYDWQGPHWFSELLDFPDLTLTAELGPDGAWTWTMAGTVAVLWDDRSLEFQLAGPLPEEPLLDLVGTIQKPAQLDDSITALTLTAGELRLVLGGEPLAGTLDFAGQGSAVLLGHKVGLENLEGQLTLGFYSAGGWLEASPGGSGWVALQDGLMEDNRLALLNQEQCLYWSTVPREDLQGCGEPMEEGTFLKTSVLLPVMVGGKPVQAALRASLGHGTLEGVAVGALGRVLATAQTGGPGPWATRLGPLVLERMEAEVWCPWGTVDCDLDFTALGTFGSRKFSASADTDHLGNLTLLEAAVPGLWKGFPGGQYWELLAVQDAAFKVLVDPATGRASQIVLDQAGWLLTSGAWPKSDFAEADNVLRVWLMAAESPWAKQDADGKPLDSPFFLQVVPFVEDLPTAVDLFWKAEYMAQGWLEGAPSKDRPAQPLGVCVENGCSTPERVSVSPWTPWIHNLKIRFASGNYRPPVELEPEGGSWSRGISGHITLVENEVTLTLRAYGEKEHLYFVGRANAAWPLLPAGLPGGAGPGITTDLVNRIANHDGSTDFALFDTRSDPAPGRKGCVATHLMGHSWSPSAQLLVRGFYPVQNGAAESIQVNIKGQTGEPGRLEFRWIAKDGREVWARTLDPVVPIDKMVHVAFAWDVEKRYFAAYADGEAAELEWGLKTGQKFPGFEGSTFIGRRVSWLDDFELQSIVPTGAEILAHRIIQPGDDLMAPEFLLSLRFDDDPFSWLFSLNKAQHTLVDRYPGMTAMPWTPLSDVELLLDLPATADDGEPGLKIRSGIGMRLPWPGGELPAAQGELVIMDNTAIGTVKHSNPLPLLPLEGPDAFIIVDKGTMQRSDLDLPPQPPTLKVDFTNYTFDLDALLAFQTGDGRIIPLAPLTGTFGCPNKTVCTDKYAQHRMAFDQAEVLGDLKLVLDQGAGITLELAQGARIDILGDSAVPNLLVDFGGLRFGGRNFAAVSLQFLTDELRFNSEVDLGKPFGSFDFGKTALSLILKFSDGTLCGKGSKQLPQGNCEASVCFTPKGPSTKVVCDGKAACSTDAQCGQGKMCLGFLCAPKLPDWSPCTAGSQCAGGACAGVCYTPHSVGEGGACTLNASDQCNPGLFCTFRCAVGNFGCGSVCLAQVAHGAPCEADAQCPNGAACDRPVFGAPKVCVFDDLEVGEGCLFPAECTTNLCVGGLCRCTPGGGGCDQGEYCDLGGLCKSPKADGAVCCIPLECQGKRCSTPGCVTGKFGELTNRGHCYTPNSVAVGGSCLGPDHCAHGFCAPSKKCQCLTNDDCPGKRCDILSGLCQNRQADGALCLLGSDCQSGHCGTLLTSLPECYTPRSRQLGDWCVATDHCASGPCELRCNFDMVVSPTSRCTIAKMYAYNAIAADLSGCGCETRCTCNENSDCPEGKWCGDYIYNGVPSGGLLHECRDPQGVGSYCNHNYECRSNNCGACNFLGCLCLCGSNSDCPNGHYCTSGACLLKKPVGVGCSNNGQCITDYCKSTLAGKVCAW